MSRSINARSATDILVVPTPLGGISSVMRSGDAYKGVGEVVKRSDYPDLSALFPRNGSFSSVLSAIPPSTGGSLAPRAIAYGGGVFVVFGVASGATATDSCLVSRDHGRTWDIIRLPSNRIWVAVAYGGGKFVALSDGNDTVVSSDGYKWTTGNNNLPFAGATSIAYGNGRFVAVGSTSGSGRTAVSTDGGNTWVMAANIYPERWHSVAYGDGMFVAVTSGNGSGSYCYSSPDGAGWTVRSAVSTACSSITYGVVAGVGMFLACGSGRDLYKSLNGTAWELVIGPASGVGTTDNFSEVVIGNGVALAFAYNYFVMSVDGVIFKRVAHADAGQSNGLAMIAEYGGGTFVYFSTGGAAVNAGLAYAENLTDSDYLHLTGTAGTFVRVK